MGEKDREYPPYNYVLVESMALIQNRPGGHAAGQSGGSGELRDDAAVECEGGASATHDAIERACCQPAAS